MKKILITGAQGQLGQCIREIAVGFPDLDFVFTDKDQLDITDQEAVSEFISSNSFDYCINAAAYTNVEKAEAEKEKAFIINADAAGNLVRACEQSGCILIHISTDYVFDGNKTSPYLESDPTKPLSVYGASKLAGEKHIQRIGEKYFIFRTSWLYSLYGHNFLRSIQKWMSEGRSLSITKEQKGVPTNGHELAEKLLDLMCSGVQDFGIYHLSNTGEATWYDFALAIARYTPGADPNLISATDHFPTKAKRPAFSVMSNGKAKSALGLTMEPWADSLRSLLSREN